MTRGIEERIKHLLDNRAIITIRFGKKANFRWGVGTRVVKADFLKAVKRLLRKAVKRLLKGCYT